MKKSTYLLAILFLVSTVFMAAPAKASTINVITVTASSSDSWLDGILSIFGLGGNTSNNNSGSTSGSNTQLPINNGVVFLMIAGIAIGVTAVNKNKLAKNPAI